jgi:DNA-binding CsgD family transcriptional regulator
MPGECWNTNEITSLITQVMGDLPLPKIAIPGKSAAAINNQRRRLKEAGRLNNFFVGRTLKPWTIRELNQLRNFTTEYGYSADFIAQVQLVPGRTKDAVSGMMHRKGLGNAAVREQAQQAHHLTDPEREALIACLQGDGRLLPTKTIAQRWGIAPKTVNGYRRRLGIPLSWQQARDSPEYQARREQLARTTARHMRKRWHQWREQREQTLKARREELALLPSPPAIRVCHECQQQWFATKEFYHVQKRNLGKRQKITMSRTCRFCRAAQRRHRRTAPHAVAASAP